MKSSKLEFFKIFALFLEINEFPCIVITGVPINNDSQVVVPPGYGKVSSITSILLYDRK